jgi:hypothetical protein
MQTDRIKSMCGLILCMILAFNCSDLPVITEQEGYQKYVVYCVLSPDYTEQSAYIGKILPFHDPIDYNDAQIVISDKGHRWTLKSQGSGYYKISSTLFQPIPLQEYTLKVDTQDDIHITAHTTIPDVFSIISPTINDSLTASLNQHSVKIQLFIQCSTSKDAYLYQAWAESNLLFGPKIKSFLNKSPTLSTTLNFWINDTLSYPKSINLNLTVIACDSNLALYASENNLVISGEYKNSISKYSSFFNALGLFGSLTKDQSEITIWHQTN